MDPLLVAVERRALLGLKGRATAASGAVPVAERAGELATAGALVAETKIGAAWALGWPVARGDVGLPDAAGCAGLGVREALFDAADTDRSDRPAQVCTGGYGAERASQRLPAPAVAAARLPIGANTLMPADPAAAAASDRRCALKVAGSAQASSVGEPGDDRPDASAGTARVAAGSRPAPVASGSAVGGACRDSSNPLAAVARLWGASPRGAA